MKPISVPELVAAAPSWVSRDPTGDGIVVSSRLRLARNVADLPFPRKARPNSRATILQRVFEVLEGIPEVANPRFAAMHDLADRERRALFERRVISSEMMNLGKGSGVVLDAGDAVSVMINEEDHLRLQHLRNGMALTAQWEELSAVDSAVAELIPFAFHDDLGFLTSCPSNVGTGLRASVMLHLPALLLRGEVEAVMRSCRELRLAARGAFGEGSEPAGGFLQISNQSTLGETEEAILTHLQRVVARLVRAESAVRQGLLTDERDRLYDAVGRAVGTLRHAYRVSSEEAFQCLGMIRLGSRCGLLPGIPVERIDPLFVDTQPGHLQILHGGPANETQRDTRRATLLRTRLFHP